MGIENDSEDIINLNDYTEEQLRIQKRLDEEQLKDMESNSIILRISKKIGVDIYKIVFYAMLIPIVIYSIIFALIFIFMIIYSPEKFQNILPMDLVIKISVVAMIIMMPLVLIYGTDGRWKYRRRINKINRLLRIKKEVSKELSSKSKIIVTHSKEHKIEDFKKCVPVEGRWYTHDWEEGVSQISYMGPYKEGLPGTDPQNVALALFEGKLESCLISAKVRYSKGGTRIARIVIGYDSKSGGYYSVGIGGYGGIAYLIDRFDENIGWRPLAGRGNLSTINKEKIYHISVEYDKKIIVLKIDNTEILKCEVSPDSTGDQVGLFSWGKGKIDFFDIRIEKLDENLSSVSKSKQKIYSQFENYDFYRDLNKIIKNVKKELFVVDSYVDEQLIDLYLADVPISVNIRILTNRPQNNFLHVAKKYLNKPGRKFEVRKSSNCHDRLVCIDDICYVFGQSIKDAANKKPTYLLPLENDEMKKANEDIWGNASKIEL